MKFFVVNQNSTVLPYHWWVSW